jgi:hypothetical protein
LQSDLDAVNARLLATCGQKDEIDNLLRQTNEAFAAETGAKVELRDSSTWLMRNSWLLLGSSPTNLAIPVTNILPPTNMLPPINEATSILDLEEVREDIEDL